MFTRGSRGYSSTMALGNPPSTLMIFPKAPFSSGIFQSRWGQVAWSSAASPFDGAGMATDAGDLGHSTAASEGPGKMSTAEIGANAQNRVSRNQIWGCIYIYRYRCANKQWKIMGHEWVIIFFGGFNPPKNMMVIDGVNSDHPRIPRGGEQHAKHFQASL